MAHIGVLEVLEDNGLSFDVITGTSAGAIIGALGKIEVGIRAYNIIMMHHSRTVEADILIEPNLDGISGTDLDSYQELISRGREAAEALLPDILDALDV